jgi:hypothetical protein
MIVRNENDNCEVLNCDKFYNEKEKYQAIWKKKYNIVLPKVNSTSVKDVVDFISKK